ncbi:MAG: hypothetical protein AAB932_03285, partial [Patescibacteria group bacterium]
MAEIYHLDSSKLDNRVVFDALPITSADLDEYIKDILEKIKTLNRGERKIVILEALQDRSIKELLDNQANEDDKNTLTDQEIANYLRELRILLFERLQKFLPDSRYYEQTETLQEGNSGNKISVIADKYGDKHVLRSNRIFSGCNEPMEKLAQLPSHHAIISTHEFDKNTHETMVQHTPLVNLIEAYENHRTEITPKTYLLALKDWVDGLEFLSQHKLYLLDLSPLNLGLKLRKDGTLGSGVLFDLESITDDERARKSEIRYLRELLITWLQSNYTGFNQLNSIIT